MKTFLPVTAPAGLSCALICWARATALPKRRHGPALHYRHPAARIALLAQQLIGKRSFITCSYSVQRAHRGEQPYWMIALSSMLGQLSLPGGGFSFGHGSMNSVGNPRQEGPVPMMSTGQNPSSLSIPVVRISDMLLNPGQPYSFQGETLHYPDTVIVQDII